MYTNSKIMKIAVYTLPYELANEVEKINKLFKAGLEELHMRKPCLKRKEFIEILDGIEEKYHSKIVIHDYLDLALDYKVKGIHTSPRFFSGLMGIIRARRYRSLENFVISTSVQKVKEINTIDPIFNRVFLGPMYSKFSAENVKVNFDSFHIKEDLRSAKMEVFAMGGIDTKNQKKIKALGFDGFILQSAIWKSDDYLNAFYTFQLTQFNESDSESNMKMA